MATQAVYDELPALLADRILGLKFRHDEQKVTRCQRASGQRNVLLFFCFVMKSPIKQGRKSLHVCLATLRVRWFDPITEPSELPKHSCSAPLLGLFDDSGAAFLVTDALVQDQPDQATLSMSTGPDGLLVS